MTDADWKSLPHTPDTPALVLFHGLEGGSNSRYAQSIAHHFRARGWIVAIAHFRGCSGTPNRLARAYYSGDSAEVGFLLEPCAAASRTPAGMPWACRWAATLLRVPGRAP